MQQASSRTMRRQSLGLRGDRRNDVMSTSIRLSALSSCREESPWSGRGKIFFFSFFYARRVERRIRQDQEGLAEENTTGITEKEAGKKASSFIPQCWTLLQTYSHVKNPTVWNDLMIIMLIFKNALLACRKEQVGTHCLRADSVGLCFFFLLFSLLACQKSIHRSKTPSR